MCDLYLDRCKICGLPLPLHLGDWATKRPEIECFCMGHLPKTNVRVFTSLSGLPRYKKGWKMGIRALTPNALMNKEKNCPNLGVDFDIEDR